MYISRESKNAIGDVYQDNNGNKTILFINKRCYLFLNTWPNWQFSILLLQHSNEQKFFVHTSSFATYVFWLGYVEQYVPLKR